MSKVIEEQITSDLRAEMRHSRRPLRIVARLTATGAAALVLAAGAALPASAAEPAASETPVLAAGAAQAGLGPEDVTNGPGYVTTAKKPWQCWIFPSMISCRK